MIVHLVILSLKPDVRRDDPRLTRAVEAMLALPQQIPQIRAFEHGYNLTADEQAGTYGLRALFDNEADLHAYFEHPQHVPVVIMWSEIAELVFCDFET
ncbi:MAG: Dabb family protein [Betaproteobacteria bacterium]|nr:Dabb family protein [Betaproteobacteria bacterium]